MTLKKAVEILYLLFAGLYEGNDFDRDQAIKLGMEALQRCRQNYLKPQCADFRRLPSEAEE